MAITTREQALAAIKSDTVFTDLAEAKRILALVGGPAGGFTIGPVTGGGNIIWAPEGSEFQSDQQKRLRPEAFAREPDQKLKELEGLETKLANPEAYEDVPEPVPQGEEFKQYYDELEQEKKDARRARWLQVGEGLQGRPAPQQGMTEAQRMAMRTDAAKVLALLDKSEKELEQQQMRWSYQSQASNAQIITALGGIVQQDIAAASQEVRAKAQLEWNRNIEGHRHASELLRNQGFAENRLRENPGLMEGVTKLGPQFKKTHSADYGGPLALIYWGGEEGASARTTLLSTLQSDLKNLNPLQKAIYLDEIKAQHGFDLFEMFQVRTGVDEKGNPTYSMGGWKGPEGMTDKTLFEAFDKSDLANEVKAAAVAREKARKKDEEGLGLRQKIYDEQAKLGRWLSPTGKNALKLMLQYADRQKLKPGQRFKIGEGGQVIPLEDKEGDKDAKPPGSEEEEKPREKTTAEKELMSIIEDLKSGNPSARSLRRKRAMMASPDLIKIADEQYEGDREAAWEALADKWRYRQGQVEDAVDINKRKAVLESPHEHSWWDVQKAKLGDIFGKKRTRYEAGMRKPDEERKEELEEYKATQEGKHHTPKPAALATQGSTTVKAKEPVKAEKKDGDDTEDGK